LTSTLGPTFAFPTASITTLPTLQLSPEEARVASWLATRLFDQRPYLELRGLYYDGLQKMQDLGISIPPSLAGLRTVIGWPRIGVDALSNRCRVEGFRYPGATDTDEDLWGIWQSNNLDSEAQLAHLDALIYGRCYLVIGPGDDTTQGQPLITAESPTTMTALWDARMRRCTAALQIYLDTDFTSDMYGQEVAALYLPDTTIQMGRASTNSTLGAGATQWEIFQRDNHSMGRVPVVRMANRCRLANRDGLSEITPEWMNTTDSANRTLLGMEVNREFHGAPQRYVLGASEDDFQAPDGTAKTAWETYLGKVWALERDADGNVPTVGEFKVGDPSVHTKLIDEYAKIMSGEMGVPPHFLGVFASGNPASADAIRSGYEELTIRSKNKHIQFGDAWEEAMRIALLIRDGAMPDGAHRMETAWHDPSPTTPASTAEAIFRQIQSGAIPAYSDVTLERLGYSAMERARLAVDRDKDMGAAFLAELASSLVAKEARVDKSLAGDINAAPPGVSAATPPTNPGPPLTPAIAAKPPGG
jgi:hypothetical protein